MNAWRQLLTLLVLTASRAGAVTEEALFKHGHRHRNHHRHHVRQHHGAVAAPDAPALQHKQSEAASRALAAAIKVDLEDDEKPNGVVAKKAVDYDEKPKEVVAEKAVDPDAQVLRKMRADAQATADNTQVVTPAKPKGVVAKKAVDYDEKPKEEVAEKAVDPDAKDLREMRADAQATADNKQVDTPAAKKLPAVDKVKVKIPANAPVHLAKEELSEDAQVEKPDVEKTSDDVQKTVEASPSDVEEEPEVEQPELPFSELQPFGRRNVGESLTESSISQSNAMVDQLERAEVAEEKRAVFRSLTRLRGVALSSFDGIARTQTGNIEEYAEHHHWRKSHPVKHLAEEESDVKSWAFPANADF